MPTHEQMVATVKAYVAAFETADPDAVAALYAADATVEDPIGSPLVQGTDAIREFYRHAIGVGAKLRLEGPVRTVKRQAVFPFSVHVEHQGRQQRIDVIDIFSFNSDGRIGQMRAYWGVENCHQVEPGARS